MSVMNQAYSYSRLSSFSQCPYKWHKQYVDKYKEPNRTYFTVGTICHRVAELSSLYCYRNTCINKTESLIIKKGIKIPDGLTAKDFSSDMFNDKSKAKDIGYSNYSNLLLDADRSYCDYETVSMPGRELYNQFFSTAVGESKCSDVEIIEESRFIMNRFFDWADFSILPGEVMMSEQKLGFTKDWEHTGFLSDNVFYRGVIDNVIVTSEGDMIITDYKSSRKMLTKWQVKEDYQLKSYATMMAERIGADKINSVTIRIIYLRYLEIVEYTFNEIHDIMEDTKTWISTMVNKIEALGDNPEKYQPVRNEYCGMCYLKEDNVCPLFERVELKEGMSHAVSDESDCQSMWKKSEVLKGEYQSLQKQCKTFIESTDAVVTIDENAVLDKFRVEAKKFVPEKVVSLALLNKVKLADILQYFGISEANVKKLIKKTGIKPTKEEYEDLYELTYRNKFDAIVRSKEDK